MEMESPQNLPTASFKTGVKMEERRLTWTIENFHVVLLHDSLLDAQLIEFTAGTSIGLESKWRVVLGRETGADGKKWAGIYFNLSERPALKSEFLFANCAFNIKDGRGRTTFNRATTAKNMYSNESGAGWGFPFMKRGEEVEDFETLTIDVTLKLYSPSAIAPSWTTTVVKFATTSPLKAFEQVGSLWKSGSLTDIRFIANDEKKWFTAKKEILSARSPVFEAMLKTNMTEGKDGVVKISDLNSKTLHVLLHYICSGELHVDWMESEVLVELTNAAAKYQLPELLHFLDGVVGKLCNVRNVGPLLALANRLSLKQAEADLLSFIRIKGTRSSEKLFGILNAMMVTREEEAAGSDMGAGEGTNNSPSSSGSTPEIKGNGREGEDPPERKKKKHDNDKREEILVSGASIK